MSDVLRLLFTAAVLVALSSCNAGSVGVNDAQTLSNALGIPVYLWAGKDDACAQKQFQHFVDQFNTASESDRGAFLVEVKKYDAVIFNGSQVVSAVTGKLRTLQLVDDTRVIAQHDFVDSREFSELHGTSVRKTEHLIINPQSAPDHSDTRVYQVSNSELYELILNGGESYLEDAVSAGKLQDVSNWGPNPVSCGALADLSDLL